MTKSKSSATSAMEVNPVPASSTSTTFSTTSATSIATSNGPTSTPAAVATPVSSSSESKVVASTKSSTMTPAPATFNNAISATEELSTSAKDKKSTPSSSTSTDAALVNSPPTVPSSTTPSTAKDTKIKGTVPDFKETSSVSDKKSASSQEVTAEDIQNYVKPKVVEKVFDLPVVSDTYDSLVKLSSPLSPYVEKIGTMTSPVVEQALDLKAGIEGKLPEVVQTGYTTALNKAVTAAASLDATLCSGVDTLVEKVPALKQSTPVLYNSTRESVGSYATRVATYVASFTIAQIFLKAADLGLETTDGLLKLTANEKVDPILRGLRRVRSEATSLRKEGIVLNGTDKAKTLEEATLIGAMLEIFGLGSFFNQPGNSTDGAGDEDAIDIVAMLPSKTRSGLVL